jgi:putative transposase
MLVLKGIKLRIYPNQLQQLQIRQSFGCNRFVWNQMLNMLMERYKNNPTLPLPSVYGLNYLLPQLKREYPFLKAAESTSLQVTNHDLIEAYQKFFKQHQGFPKFKSQKYPKQSYQAKIANQNINVVGAHQIKLPKLGIVKFKAGTKIEGRIKAVTIRLTVTQKYYAMVLVDAPVTPLRHTKQTVGLDLGVADLVITSTGIKYPTIRFDKQLAHKKYYWEQRLARRRRQAQAQIAWDHHCKVLEPRNLSNFKNYQKAKLMVAKYSEKIANQRRNYLHQISKALVEQYDVIKIEDLKAKNLLKNHHLARAIANQSWRQLRLMLTYKAAWYGKRLVLVNPYKTSQICANCGYDDGYHALNIRQWTCPNCKIIHDRDVNAALNICQA